MGPSLIFDKSALESLSPDEAVWLDQFFLANITPLFFVETLADLQKTARFGDNAGDVVSSLAYKTPDLHSKANVHHRTMLEGELSGAEEVGMDGRPVIGGGRYVELGGQTGAVFEASPEEEAMQRWKERKFLELERFYAKQWRDALSSLDFEETYKYYQKLFGGQPKPKTLQEVKAMADRFIDSPEQEMILQTGLASIGVAPKFQSK